MAIETKILRAQSPVSSSPSFVKVHYSGAQHSSELSVNEPHVNCRCNLFLLHNSSDAPWTAKLAQRVCEERIGNRRLRLSLSDWNSAKSADSPVDLKEYLRGPRLLGIVVSRAMLQEDYQATQKAIELLLELAPTAGRIVTILKENVTLPPLLRLHEWFDFRNEEDLDENLSELISFLYKEFSVAGHIAHSDAELSVKHPASAGVSSSFGIGLTRERIISNLFPVAELPQFAYSAETRFTSETELTEACGGAGPSPFLLKGARLYTIEPLSQDSIFAPALSSGTKAEQEDFTQWLSRRDRAGWAAELLNNLLRHHAWKRGLRYDKSAQQFYFPRTKPKSVWWEINRQTISREVTAPYMGWIELENDIKAEVQYGWRHRSIRGGFVQVHGNLFLQLEPSWLLTNLDGKTPTTSQPVGPVFSGAPQQERNGQFLRSLRFWSTVLAKGHNEIRINTGQAPVRIKLTPLSGFTQFGIASDQMDYDQLMVAEMEDDLLMPALGPLEEESVISNEEIISSETFRHSRNGQSEARTNHGPA